MPLTRLRLLFGFLALAAALGVRAEFSRPIGIWDMSGRATVSGTFPDRKTKTARKVPVFAFVQFKDDGSFTTIPWQRYPGRWQFRRKTYRIDFDLAQANAGQSRPPFLGTLLTAYHGLAQKKYQTAPPVDRIEVLAFRDRGRLINRGLALAGSSRIDALLHFADPLSHQPVAAKVRMALAYRASRASAPSTCCSSDDPAQNQADSDAFLKDNAKLPGVRTTASGLQYRILYPGAHPTTAPKPSASSTVTIDYRGILPSGQYFDGNSGATFAVSQVIAGFAEGLKLMPEGAYYRFYIPPPLAYGARAHGPVIKPNAALIFDVVLTKVQ